MIQLKPKSFLILMVLTVSLNTLMAQNTESNQQLGNILETQAANFGENQDFSQIAEQLQDLEDNPILINFASVEDLQQLIVLDIFTIHNLIKYRKETGGIHSEYELLQITGFNQNLIKQLVPYLDFSTKRKLPPLDLASIHRRSKHLYLLRYWRDLPLRKGFIENDAYLGALNSFYSRYRGTYQNLLSVGFTMQQDAGEPINHPSQAFITDYISGHVGVNNYGKLKTLLVGDFHAEFGQGLSLWTSFNSGKTIFANDVKKYGTTFKPHTGSEENRFLRGAAVDYMIGSSLELGLFYSQNKIDANQTVSYSELDIISSLQNTGLHRTEGELEDKNSLTSKIYGVILKHRGKSLNIGFNGHFVDLSNPVLLFNSYNENYRRSSDALYSSSLCFNWIRNSFNLFGEFSFSQNQGFAGSFGMQTKLSDYVKINSLFRSFSQHYQSFYSAPFSENENNAERGIYTGLIWNISKNIELKTFSDFYEFRQPSYFVKLPSNGMDAGVQINFKASRFTTFYFRYQIGQNQITNDDLNSIQLKYSRLSRTRLNIDFLASSKIRLRSRVETSNFESLEKGILIYQDLIYKMQSLPLSLMARYAYINVTDYNARIYAYENDLNYTFSIPAYFGKSSRFYILSTVQLYEKTKFQFKYSLSHFRDREVISSGLNEINGNVLHQLRLQLLVKF